MSHSNTQEVVSADQFKTAKDSLVASLFELSKAATEVSKNAIDYFNLIHSVEQLSNPPIEEIKNSVSSGSIIDSNSSSNSTTASKKSTKKSKAKSEPVIQNIVDEEPEVAETTTFLDAPTSPVEESKKVQRKKRAPKDPNAPKKPLTSYILFYNHLRASVAEKNTGLSQIDIAREISNQWKVMSDADKNYWKGLYEKEKVKYDAAMIKYNESKDAIIPSNGEKRPASEDEELEIEPIEIIEAPKKKKSRKSKKAKNEE